MLSRTMLTVR